MTDSSIASAPSASVPSPEANSGYFDLHTFGVGYVNRIREVGPKQGRQGDPFLACTVSALNGPRNNVAYRYYDVRVSGKDAQHLIRRCKPSCDAGKKVLIGFCLGDEWTNVFVYPPHHAKAGETGVTEKARLLFIGWIKIDGQMVYRAKDRSTKELPVEAPAPAAPAIDDAPESVEGAAFAAA